MRRAWPKRVEAGFILRATEVAANQVVGQMEGDRRRPDTLDPVGAQFHRQPDDPPVLRPGRPHEFRRQDQLRVGNEFRGQAVIREFLSVPLNVREADLQALALREDRMDMGDRLRFRRFDDRRLRREVERDAEHIRVFGVEEAFVVQLVRLPAQRPPDDLFAEELGSRRPGCRGCALRCWRPSLR